MAPYPYQQLNLPEETRILIISPGKYDDDIVCSLSHMKLAPETEPYEALSYCWSKSVNVDKEPDYDTKVSFAVYGDGVSESREVQFRDLLGHPYMEPHYIRQGGVIPPGTILCDGVEMPVGGELHRAIKALRHKDSPLRIWIDALCINQDDIQERNKHVKVMGEVYAGAKIVRIWLGERIGIETEALHTLETASEIFNDAFEELVSGPFTPVDVELKIKKDKRTADLTFESLDMFFHRAWFQRIWVIQEVANAANATVHIGSMTLDWEWLSRITTAARMYKLDRIFTSYTMNSICIMSWLSGRKDVEDRIAIPLLDALEETRRFQSTLASDKLYGILGLVENARGIAVDYSIPGDEIFRRLSLNFLNKNQSLEMLYHCVHPQTPSSFNLPSWVADWTAPGYVEPLRSRRLVASAAGDTEPLFNIDVRANTLSIIGKEVGKVAVLDELRVIAPTQPPEGIGSWYATDTKAEGTIDEAVKNSVNSTHRNEIRDRLHRESVRKSLENIIKIASPDPTRETIQTIARTFMCNNTPEGDRPDEFCLLLGWSVFFHYNIMEMNPEDAHRAAADGWKEYYNINDENLAEYDAKVRQAFATFIRSYGRWPYNRRFFKTEDGRFGWGVNGMQPGDIIAVLYGGKYPFILRHQEGKKYKIVGDCYIDGFMDKEALDDAIPEKIFHIV